MGYLKSRLPYVNVLSDLSRPLTFRLLGVERTLKQPYFCMCPHTLGETDAHCGQFAVSFDYICVGTLGDPWYGNWDGDRYDVGIQNYCKHTMLETNGQPKGGSLPQIAQHTICEVCCTSSRHSQTIRFVQFWPYFLFGTTYHAEKSKIIFL